MSDADTETGDGNANANAGREDALAPGGTNPEHADRTTSPMQNFSSGAVTKGAIVLLVGLAVTFGVPFVL